MKKLFLSLFVLSLCLACNSNTQKKGPEVSPLVEKSRKRTQKQDTQPASLDNVNEAKKESIGIDYSTTIADFINCKNNATERTQCRNNIPKVLHTSHHISDFGTSESTYVVYDSIRPIISRSREWKKLGSALNQQNLDKALSHTNNGGLSLIIDTENIYGHVVMVIPGSMKKSNSWNLQLPPVLSLLNYKPEQSFAGKTLAYAMKRSESLQIYIRKK